MIENAVLDGDCVEEQVTQFLHPALGKRLRDANLVLECAIAFRIDTGGDVAWLVAKQRHRGLRTWFEEITDRHAATLAWSDWSDAVIDYLDIDPYTEQVQVFEPESRTLHRRYLIQQGHTYRGQSRPRCPLLGIVGSHCMLYRSP